MSGRSFGTANGGDYVVPERYGGTVYKRPSEKKEEPAKEHIEAPVRPVSGGVRLSPMAHEMHEQDIRRITSEDNSRSVKTDNGDPVAETVSSDGKASPEQNEKLAAKKGKTEISEEDLLIIGLIILMLGGNILNPATDKKTDIPGENDIQHTPSEVSAASAKDAVESIKTTAEKIMSARENTVESDREDLLIPLLLTLLIW